MTKEELLLKLADIEWDDFECKAARTSCPRMCGQRCRHSPTPSGGWIVFGIRQVGKRFEIQGVNNGEWPDVITLRAKRGSRTVTVIVTEGHSQRTGA